MTIFHSLAVSQTTLNKNGDAEIRVLVRAHTGVDADAQFQANFGERPFKSRIREQRSSGSSVGLMTFEYSCVVEAWWHDWAKSDGIEAA